MLHKSQLDYHVILVGRLVDWKDLSTQGTLPPPPPPIPLSSALLLMNTWFPLSDVINGNLMVHTKVVDTLHFHIIYTRASMGAGVISQIVCPIAIPGMVWYSYVTKPCGLFTRAPITLDEQPPLVWISRSQAFIEALHAKAMFCTALAFSR